MKLETQSAGIYNLAIDPSGVYVACALQEAPLKVYRIADGREVLSLRDQNLHSASAADWYQKNGKLFLLVGYAAAGYMRLVDLEGNDYIRFGRKSSDYGYPNAAQLNADSINALLVVGDNVHTAGHDAVSARFHLAMDDASYVTYSRKLEKKTRTGSSAVDCLLWRDDTIMFAVNSPSTSSYPSFEIRRYNLTTMRERAGERLQAHSRDIVALEKISDELFATLGWDGYLRTWHYENWSLSGERQVAGLGNADGTPLAMKCHEGLLVLSIDSTINLVDKITLDPVGALTYHEGNVQALAISAETSTIISGDSKGIIHINPL